MKSRIPHPDDQINTENVFQKLCQFTNSIPEVEENIWIGAMWSRIVLSYINNGVEFSHFRSDCIDAIENYREWFEDDLD